MSEVKIFARNGGGAKLLAKVVPAQRLLVSEVVHVPARRLMGSEEGFVVPARRLMVSEEVFVVPAQRLMGLEEVFVVLSLLNGC